MSEFEDYLPNIAKAVSRSGHGDGPSDPMTLLQYMPDSYAVLKHKTSKAFCKITYSASKLVFTDNHYFYDRLSDLVYLDKSFKHDDFVDSALTWFLARATYSELPIIITPYVSKTKNIKFDNISTFEIRIETSNLDFYTIAHIIDEFITLDFYSRLMLTNLKRGNVSKFSTNIKPKVTYKAGVL